MKQSNIRLWNYNRERQVLNVHFTDGRQVRVKVVPSQMKEVFAARNNEDNSTVNELIGNLAESCSHAKVERYGEELAIEVVKRSLGI